MISEDFIHFLWKFRLLNPSLSLESGESVDILNPGEQNCDSGPDFFNARLRIGKTLWAGNVEIHVKASDWYRHRHQDDKAYANTILHVVYEPDAIATSGDLKIPTLVIRNQFPIAIMERYHMLMLNQQWIPCGNQSGSLHEEVFRLWAPGLSVERLLGKSYQLERLWHQTRNDWEETLYRHLAIQFGFRINMMPFELLSKSLPLRVVRRHCSDRFQTEALAFGQAGLLGQAGDDEFPAGLLREYSFLKGKYQLQSMECSLWKFLRLRPSSFPTIRISQWAAFLHKTACRFFGMVTESNIQEVKELLAVHASAYWDDHYRFGKPSGYFPKMLGEQAVNVLIINGIIPFLFFYGEQVKEERFREKALCYLEEIPGESNQIIRKWAEAGIPASNGLYSQALLELKRQYCDRKRCLECRLGKKLLAG